MKNASGVGYLVCNSYLLWSDVYIFHWLRIKYRIYSCYHANCTLIYY